MEHTSTGGASLLSKEDVTKLHNEINMYIAQSYAVRLGAVSVVAVVIGLITQNTRANEQSTLTVAYFAATTLLGFLSFLYILMCSLRVQVQRCSAYLRLTRSSQWEIDNAVFSADAPKLNRYLTSSLAYFMYLGLVAAGWPLLLGIIRFNDWMVFPYLVVHLSVALLYIILLWLILPKLVHVILLDTEARWVRILQFRVNPSAAVQVDERRN